MDEFTDIPPELISLARSIVRDCRNPGRYAVNFTVSDHKNRVKDAQIIKLERIRDISLRVTHR